MWLQRVLFNVKTRLLNHRNDVLVGDRRTDPPHPNIKDQRAQSIQHRLTDLDKRLAELNGS